MKNTSNNEIGELTAILKARDFTREATINCVPVQLEQYLEKLNIRLVINKELSYTQAGRVITLPDQRIIIEVNGNDSNERQRFTVLHEMAHIVLALPSNHVSMTTTAGLYTYTKRPEEEILCDIFAAECLFPREYFKPDVNNTDPCMEAVDDLAKQYQASLTATASRYAANTDELCASVLSENGIIRYVSMSRVLREKGFWVPVGTPAPQKTQLEKRLSDQSNDIFAEVPAHYWTNHDSFAGRMLCEESIVLDMWNQALSLLWFEDDIPIQQTQRRQYDEDDELLPELDGQLPWPSRRKRK